MKQRLTYCQAFTGKAQSADIITCDCYFHQKSIYIQIISTPASLSLALSLSSSISRCLPSLSLSPSLPRSFFIFLHLSPSPRSAFHVTPLAGVTEGGVMASLCGVLAAVSLQLLGGYTRSTSWVSEAVWRFSPSDISFSSFA